MLVRPAGEDRISRKNQQKLGQEIRIATVLFSGFQTPLNCTSSRSQYTFSNRILYVPECDQTLSTNGLPAQSGQFQNKRKSWPTFSWKKLKTTYQWVGIAIGKERVLSIDSMCWNRPFGCCCIANLWGSAAAACARFREGIFGASPAGTGMEQQWCWACIAMHNNLKTEMDTGLAFHHKTRGRWIMMSCMERRLNRLSSMLITASTGITAIPVPVLEYVDEYRHRHSGTSTYMWTYILALALTCLVWWWLWRWHRFLLCLSIGPSTTKGRKSRISLMCGP